MLESDKLPSIWERFENKVDELFYTAYKLPHGLQITGAETVDKRLQLWRDDLKDNQDKQTVLNDSPVDNSHDINNDLDDTTDDVGHLVSVDSDNVSHLVSVDPPPDVDSDDASHLVSIDLDNNITTTKITTVTPSRPKRACKRKSLPDGFVDLVAPQRSKRKPKNDSVDNKKDPTVDDSETEGKCSKTPEGPEQPASDQQSAENKVDKSNTEPVTRKQKEKKSRKGKVVKKEKDDKTKKRVRNKKKKAEDEMVDKVKDNKGHEEVIVPESNDADVASNSATLDGEEITVQVSENGDIVKTEHLEPTMNMIKKEKEDVESTAENKPPKSKKTPKSPKFPKREKKFLCQNCPRGFTHEYLLMAHQHLHDGKKLICPHCPKEFMSRGGYITHVRSHFVEEVKHCPYCNYMSGSQSMVNAHVKQKHERKLKHLCDICGTGFVTADRLKRHRAAVHCDIEKKDAYQCDQCNFKTSTANCLSIHKKNMHSERPSEYVCNICGTVLKYKQSLLDHQRRHFSKKNYQCSMCTFTGVCEKDVRNHIRRMHIAPTDKCQVCGKVFSQKGHLQRHMAVHTGRKDYACQYCSYKCNVKGNLSKHVQLVHNRVERLRNNIERLDTNNHLDIAEEFSVKVQPPESHLAFITPEEVTASVEALEDTKTEDQVEVYEEKKVAKEDLIEEEELQQPTVYEIPMDTIELSEEQYEHIVYVQPGTDLDQLGFVDENGQQLVAIAADS